MESKIAVALTVACCVLITIAGSCTKEAEEFGGMPRITFEKAVWDLGEIPANKNEPYSVMIRCENHGLGELQVEGLVVSCGCVGARIDRDVLSPGEGAWITFDISRSTPEKRRASLVVHSNDANSPRSELHFSWRTIGRIELEPPSVDLGTIVTGQVASADVMLLCRDRNSTDPFEPLLSDPPAGLRVLSQACDADMPAGCQKFVIEVAGIGATGEAFASVPIVQRGRDNPELFLPVRWRVSEIVDVSPRSVMLRPGRPGEHRSQLLTVSAAQGKELAIDKVEIGSNALEAESSCKVIGESVITIELESRLPESVGCHRFMLYVWCREPSKQRISVPVIAYVVGSAASSKQ